MVGADPPNPSHASCPPPLQAGLWCVGPHGSRSGPYRALLLMHSIASLSWLCWFSFHLSLQLTLCADSTPRHTGAARKDTVQPMARWSGGTGEGGGAVGGVMQAMRRQYTRRRHKRGVKTRGHNKRFCTASRTCQPASPLFVFPSYPMQMPCTPDLRSNARRLGTCRLGSLYCPAGRPSEARLAHITPMSLPSPAMWRPFSPSCSPARHQHN